MPKKANYHHKELLNAFLLNKEELADNISRPSHEVWGEISKALENRITRKAAYTHLRKCVYCKSELLINPDRTKETSTTTDESSEDTDYEDVLGSFTLTYLEWSTFMDTLNNKTTRNWTINFLLFVQKHVPRGNCILYNKRYKITESGRYYGIFFLYCQECTRKLMIFCHKPDDLNPCIFYYKTLNANNICNTSIKRKQPLRGSNREEVGAKLASGQLAVNIQREMALKYESSGEVNISSLVPSLEVLRKIKEEHKKRNSKIQFQKCSIDTLQLLKYTLPYSTYIHNIGLDPFFVHYWTSEQRQVLKSYCKNSQCATLQLDATGTLVKKISRPNHNYSGNIFLYEGVIYLDNKGKKKHLPICQMLSERHTINAIAYWLDEWTKHCAASFKIVISDHSFALLGAFSKVFGGFNNLSQYIKSCFDLLCKRDATLPSVFIRVDFAHLMKLTSSWDCLRNKTSLIRQFYLRSIAQLARAVDFEDFIKIVEALFVTSNSLYDNVDAAESKTYLKGLISGYQEVLINDDRENESETEFHYATKENLKEDREQFECPDTVKLWIDTLFEECIQKCPPTTARFDANENFFYLPKFSMNLKKLLRTFVLWSGVMRRQFGVGNVTASSANVESYFNDLKNRTFVAEKLPINVDKFIVKHIDSIRAMTILSECHTEQDNNDEDHKHDVFENWRGLGNPTKKKRFSFYSKPCPEILYAKENDKVKIPLLQNANNINKNYILDRKTFIIQDTCAFDSLIQGITSAYCDSLEYKNSLMASITNLDQEEVIGFVINFLENGLNKNNIYQVRFLILQKISVNTEILDGTFRINCATNICILLERFIGEKLYLASGIDDISCGKCNYNRQHVIRLLPINLDLLKESFNLEKAICDCIMKNSVCKRCSEVANHVLQIRDQVYVELQEIDMDIRTIPALLTLNNKQFIFRSAILYQPPVAKTKEAVGHYTTVCRRNDGCFELYDDLGKKVISLASSYVASISLLIYTI